MGAIGEVAKIIVNNQETLGRTIGWTARKGETLSGETFHSMFKDGISSGLKNLNHEADYFEKASDLIKTKKNYEGMSIPQKVKTFFSKDAKIESKYITDARTAIEESGGKATKRAVREEALKTVSNGIKNGEIKLAEETAEKGLKGILKKVPVVGAIMTLGCEIPNLISAHKNGDLGKQTGRSALNVLGFSGGTLAATAIGTAICPGIGTAAGFIVGMVGGALGSMGAEKVGNAVFGKSIEDQKKEVEEKQEQQPANSLSYMG